MDRADRNFLALTSTSAGLAAFSACAFLSSLAPLLLGVAEAKGVALPCALPAASLAGLFAISIALATRALWKQMAASRRLSRRIDAMALRPTSQLQATAKQIGLDDRVALIDSTTPFSFVYGLLLPRVAISRGLLGSLSGEELRATLEHESYHVRSFDPFKSLIGEVLTAALFLLPSLSVLRERYEAARELAADQHAESACGRRPLVAALLKALEGPTRRESSASVPLASSNLLAMRLFRVETGQPPKLAIASHWSLASSALGVGLLMALFATSVLDLGGSAALTRVVATQFSVAGVLNGVVPWVAPILAVSASASWLLSRPRRNG